MRPAAGVAGVVLLPPFYYKDVTVDGLAASYEAVIERVADPRLKVVLYHIPPIAQVPLPMALIERLRQRHPETVVGIKDSGGDLAHMVELVRRFPGLSVLAGADPLMLPLLREGGARLHHRHLQHRCGRARHHLCPLARPGPAGRGRDRPGPDQRAQGPGLALAADRGAQGGDGPAPGRARLGEGGPAAHAADRGRAGGLARGDGRTPAGGRSRHAGASEDPCDHIWPSPWATRPGSAPRSSSRRCERLRGRLEAGELEAAGDRQQLGAAGGARRSWGPTLDIPEVSRGRGLAGARLPAGGAGGGAHPAGRALGRRRAASPTSRSSAGCGWHRPGGCRGSSPHRSTRRP